MNRLRIKIVGASGTGLLSTGDILTNALSDLGFYAVSDREFPSVIKGGHSSYTLNLSTDPILGLSEQADVMIALDKDGMEKYIHELKDGGILVHAYERFGGIKDLMEELAGRNVEVISAPGRKTVTELGGHHVMVNVLLIGMFWKLLGYDYSLVEEAMKEKFASKPKLLAMDLIILAKGFELSEKKIDFALPKKGKVRKFINGNRAITLGAIHAGCRAYYAYPMSPASSILTYMAELVPKTGMIVKQAEDEITAAQLAIGSMYMGTRAMTATSGGGFDLMTESVSLVGMIEVPFVAVIAQRPGPATGLPTWTGQGDYQMAKFSGHGEYTRLVLSVSNAQDSFELIQHAFNYAELYQIPVIVLTEKQIAESLWTVDEFEEGAIPIQRGLVEGKDLDSLESKDRYRITESGVSKRWIPGSSDKYYFTNGDEHLEDGTLTEDAEPSKAMIAKRIRKGEALAAALPEPVIYGEAKADISFIGWGSSANIMRDIVAQFAAEGVAVNYLHYTYLFPLKVDTLTQFFADNKNVHLIEGNYTGQFGQDLEARGHKFAGKLLKWNGRSIYLEEVTTYINENL
ncbi:MAG: 2-oxoglutarate ferredoxin oxidoreductase subunit alpha [Oceanicoccus sp.]|jgi:2-oxoglutarate ferredoxin oxidoreductase subunit alpha